MFLYWFFVRFSFPEDEPEGPPPPPLPENGLTTSLSAISERDSVTDAVILDPSIPIQAIEMIPIVIPIAARVDLRRLILTFLTAIEKMTSFISFSILDDSSILYSNNPVGLCSNG